MAGYGRVTGLLTGLSGAADRGLGCLLRVSPRPLLLAAPPSSPLRATPGYATPATPRVRHPGTREPCPLNSAGQPCPPHGAQGAGEAVTQGEREPGAQGRREGIPPAIYHSGVPGYTSTGLPGLWARAVGGPYTVHLADIIAPGPSLSRPVNVPDSFDRHTKEVTALLWFSEK